MTPVHPSAAAAARAARLRRLLLPLLLGLAAAAAVLVATRRAPVASPDSFSYLGSAEWLVRHGALRVPTASWDDDDSTVALFQFAPGYPVAVAAGVAAGARPLDAARAVNAVAALLVVALLGTLVAAAAGTRAAVVLPFALLALRGVAFAFVSAWSEPLFIAALAATLVLMVRQPARPWTYGLAAAGCNLVRYAGISIVGAAGVWAALWSLATVRGSRGGRLGTAAWRAIVAIAPGVVAQALWAVRVRRLGERTPAGVFRWMGHLRDTLGQGEATVASQLFPFVPLSPWTTLATVAALLLAALVVARARRAAQLSREATAGRGSLVRRVTAAALVTGACYAAILLYSRLFVGAGIQFDDRILAPLFVLVVVAIAASLPTARRRLAPRARRALLALVAAWVVAGDWRSVQLARDATGPGRGDYLAEEWQTAEARGWLRTEGRGHPIFTNNPVAVWFTVGRPARELPATLAPDSVAAIGEQLRDAGGIIVGYRVPLVPVADPHLLAQALGFCLVAWGDGGAIWVPPESTVGEGQAPPRCTASTADDAILSGGAP